MVQLSMTSEIRLEIAYQADTKLGHLQLHYLHYCLSYCRERFQNILINEVLKKIRLSLCHKAPRLERNRNYRLV